MSELNDSHHHKIGTAWVRISWSMVHLLGNVPYTGYTGYMLNGKNHLKYSKKKNTKKVDVPGIPGTWTFLGFLNNNNKILKIQIRHQLLNCNKSI